MKYLKPRQGRVILTHNGRKIELPTEATGEILNIPAVKYLLAKGIIELVDNIEEPKKPELPQPPQLPETTEDHSNHKKSKKNRSKKGK